MTAVNGIPDRPLRDCDRMEANMIHDTRDDLIERLRHAIGGLDTIEAYFGVGSMARGEIDDLRAAATEAADALASMEGWQDIASAPRSDDEDQPCVLILQNGHRYVAEWDAASGYFFSTVSIDGREPGYEHLGRLYGATHWCPLPAPPSAMLSAVKSPTV